MTSSVVHEPATQQTQEPLAKRAARGLLALAMVAVGVLHFVTPEPFVRIVPPQLPQPLLLVWASGAAEVALGAGLLAPRLRRLSAHGLVALYVAVFPANIYMAVAGVQLDPANPLPGWVPWARLPFQVLFVAWALWVRGPAAAQGSASSD